jgi:hypothetical protein
MIRRLAYVVLGAAVIVFLPYLVGRLIEIVMSLPSLTSFFTWGAGIVGIGVIIYGCAIPWAVYRYIVNGD